MISSSPPRLDAPLRRLHPVTFIQRIIVSLPGFVVLLLPLFRTGGAEAYFQIGWVILYGVVAVPLVFMHYWLFRYAVRPSEIVIESGVLNRRTRNIPLERIQNVEIEQPLLARLFGAAKVKIETGGSGEVEGVLELVSIAEAHRIRQVVRGAKVATATGAQQEGAASGADAAPTITAPASALADEIGRTPLLTMSLRRVLLSGIFRFSVLYVVLIASAFQYLDLTPDAIIRAFERGALRPITDYASSSPWTVAAFLIGGAIGLAWLAGIAINMNRYYGFSLYSEEDRLLRKHGLLTLRQGATPLRRVQTLVLRANLIMRHLNWWRLELQVMGFDVKEQGRQVIAPLVHLREALDITRMVLPVELPEIFSPVSELYVRRATLRYGVLVLALAGAGWLAWSPALWLLCALPLAWIMARLQYRQIGYALQNGSLFVRSGLIIHYVWIIPAERFQVFYRSASFFQRRLGISNVYVDTAGAQRFRRPVIRDLPNAVAAALLERLQQSFLHEERQAVADHSAGAGGASIVLNEQSPR